MRIALITGGASGLGLATAHRLAADGLAVAIADLDADKAGSAAASMPANGAIHIGMPEEIAAAVSYLVSPGAAFVTGATIDVNGGMLMR